MRSIVLFATRHGNTRRVAETIGVALERYGTVQVLGLADAGAPPDGTELVIVGGPTEAHGLTPDVHGFFTALPDGCLAEIMAAAFDTRLNWPHFVSGSAADAIARRLEMAGADVLRPQGSFLVTMKPELRPGELARASDWALDIGERAAATVARRHVAAASGAAGGRP